MVEEYDACGINATEQWAENEVRMWRMDPQTLLHSKEVAKCIGISKYNDDNNNKGK